MDLATFLRESHEALASATTPEFPAFPTPQAVCGSGQVSDNNYISHVSRIPHTGSDKQVSVLDFNGPGRAGAGVGAGAREYHHAGVGTAGTAGNRISVNFLSFPHSHSQVGSVGKDGPPTDPTPAAEAQAAFEERAGFLEFDCGLSREAAEAQAKAEAGSTDLVLWRAGLDSLRADADPCPGYRPGEWRTVLAHSWRFLDEFGERAVALGWTTEQLFGVHPTHGVIRLDHCGALSFAWDRPATEIDETLMRFGHLTYRRDKPGKPDGILIWEFGR